jgi:2-dehydro-3-deoxyphosphogluconate aldolase/(4S)-4-hydroxy-2-oxoglutarate aldolase
MVIGIDGHMDLPTRLHAIGIIPVVQLPRPELAVPLAEVLAGAGLPCLEVTFRAAGASGAAEAIRAIRGALPDVLVGAGTVLTIEQADAAIEAGAQFIVSPGTNPRVVDHVLERGARMIPGVASPSDIEANLERGLDLLKFFPAEALGGPAFLRSVLGPFDAVRFIPSGGVTPDNLASYLSLANVTAVGGTWIAQPSALEAGDLDTVERRAEEAVALVRHARASSAGAR